MSQPGGAHPIPTPTSKASSEIPHHWWFDRHQTGVFNSTSPSNSPTASPHSLPSFSPPRYGEDFHPPDPKVPIPQPASSDVWRFREDWSSSTQIRRTSLRSGLIFDDFATPD
jgi:hypothetical protein